MFCWGRNERFTTERRDPPFPHNTVHAIMTNEGFSRLVLLHSEAHTPPPLSGPTPTVSRPDPTVSSPIPAFSRPGPIPFPGLVRYLFQVRSSLFPGRAPAFSRPGSTPFPGLTPTFSRIWPPPFLSRPPCTLSRPGLHLLSGWGGSMVFPQPFYLYPNCFYISFISIMLQQARHRSSTRKHFWGVPAGEPCWWGKASPTHR